jgi:DNA-binding PadR family transcriptional regulator
MPPVFAHGRLRLYLLKLLDEAPRHGYEVIRLLEQRFHGRYAPSAGTVYPRLAKLEAEGLVTHTIEGGRKVYSITDAGRAELADRGGELADLELEIRALVSELTAEIRQDVRGSASDLHRTLRAAARQARTSAGEQDTDETRDGHGTDWDAWLRAKEEWKEQVRRAKEESRRAKQEAQHARKQAKDAQDFAREEFQRIARQVQEQTQEHLRTGDWQRAVREGCAEITREMTSFARQPSSAGAADAPEAAERVDVAGDTGAAGDTGGAGDTGRPTEPEWAREPGIPSGHPGRDLERLLDRFRDDIRDAARDHGVTADQLRDARRHLSTAAAHIGALLRDQRP